MILGSTFFHDLLKPSAILCKILQKDEVCGQWNRNYPKTSKVVDKLKALCSEDLPTVKKVMTRIKQECGSVSDQGVDLKKYAEVLAFFKPHHQQHMDLVQECLCDRVEVQSVDLLTHALTILATPGWERSESTTYGYESLENVCWWFLYLWRMQRWTVLVWEKNGMTFWTTPNSACLIV